MKFTNLIEQLQVYLPSDIRKNQDIFDNRQFLVYCGFWFLMAFLEFLQDYISTVLNNNYFSVFESLAYKVFWLFFIPSSLLMIRIINKFKTKPKTTFLIICGTQILLLSVLHLILFSLFLFGTSKIIHGENSWHLSWLIIEKFSSRLYIALALYTVIVFAYLGLKRKKESKTSKPLHSKTIKVKNGRKSVIVNVDSIKWISADGPYLLLHTIERKHIISDSLKNIITSLPDNFKRIHRSTIVNIDMIKELKSRMNGDYDVIMNDTNMLRLSRNYSKSLKGILL